MADGASPSASHGSQEQDWEELTREDALVPPGCDQSNSFGRSSCSCGPVVEPSKLTSVQRASNTAFLAAEGDGSTSATGSVTLTSALPYGACDARMTTNKVHSHGYRDGGERAPEAIAAATGLTAAAVTAAAAFSDGSGCQCSSVDDQLESRERQLKQDIDDMENAQLSMEMQQLLPPLQEKAGSGMSRQLLTQAARYSLETARKEQLSSLYQMLVETLEKKCARLASMNATVCKEKTELKVENKRLLQKVSRLEKERDNVSLPTTPSEPHVSVIQDRSQQSETSTQQADAIVSLTAQLQAMRDKIERQKATIDSLSSANRRWDDHCHKITEQRNVEIRNYEQTISQQAERIAELEQSVYRFTAQLDEVKVNETKRQKDIDRLLLSTKKRLETVEAERDALSENIRHTEHERTLASRGLVAARQEADELQATCTRLQQQVLELQQQQQHQQLLLRRQVHSSTTASPVVPTYDVQAAAELREQNAVLRQQIEVYRDDFNSERSDRERLQQKILEQQRQYERLKSDFLASQHRSSRTEEELAKARTEASRLQTQLSMQAAEIRSLRQATVAPWRCGRCTYQNPAGRKYCEICGSEGGSMAASGSVCLESRSVRTDSHLFSAAGTVLPSAPSETTGRIGGAHTSSLSSELVVTDTSPPEASATRTETQEHRRD